MDDDDGEDAEMEENKMIQKKETHAMQIIRRWVGTAVKMMVWAGIQTFQHCCKRFFCLTSPM